MQQRPNFYLILELDPSVTDWSVIEAKIQDKRRLWSTQKNQGAPSARRKAERYMKYLPEMASILKDPESRKEEAKRAVQEKKQAKKGQLEQLDQLIGMFHTATVSSKDVRLLVQKTGKVFSEQEIEKRLKKQGITLEQGSSAKKRQTRPKLESSVAKGIRDELDTLKLASLYDFLSLDHTGRLNVRSSPQSLYDRGDSIYKELSRSGKTDADTTLKMNLAGRVKSVFKDATEKEKYDNTLATEVLTELNNPLEIAGRDKFIEEKELRSLLDLARAKGVREELAFEYIETYAGKRKWGVQQEQEAKKERLLCCGFCDTIAETPSDKLCRKCGQELVKPCPKCGNPTPTEQAVCTKCGCHTGDAPLVKALLKSAEESMNSGDFSQAADHLDRVLDYWPDWPPAVEQKKQVAASQQEHDQALSTIGTLVATRKFEAASAKTAEYVRRFGRQGIAIHKTKIDQALQSAERAFAAAEQMRRSGKTEDAFDKYEEALSYCTDFSSAQAALAGSPPSPPGKITAQWIGQTLRLNWHPLKVRGKISYKVVRKERGLPVHAQDGHLIADTANATVDDADIASGRPYFYGVFSIRGGVASPHCAGSGPHLQRAEVRQVEYTAGDQQVTIKWQPPVGCQSVEVWRREGPAPVKPGQGIRLLRSEDSLLDTGLRNGRSYGYLLVARFQDPHGGGQPLFSDGVKVAATPVELPAPVLDLTAERKDRAVFLSWTAPTEKAVNVQIRRIQTVPDVTPGQLFSVQQLSRFGVPVPNTSLTTAQLTLTTQGQVFFVPLSIVGETAVAGKPASVTTIDEVSDFTAQKNGKNIILTWSWPVGATEVVLAVHHRSFPKRPAADDAHTIRITKAEYDRDNFWELRSAVKEKHYFTIFVHDPKADIYSTGVSLLETMGQESAVRYAVKVRKSFFFRKIKAVWIELQGHAVEELEDIAVVLKNKFPPLSKNDGTVLFVQEKLRFTEGKASIEIPDRYHSSCGFIKIFFNSPQTVQEVRLMPSAQQKLWLG
jgi:hypothetical protein